MDTFDAGNQSFMLQDYNQMKIHQLISRMPTLVTDQCVQKSRHAVDELIDAFNGQSVPLLCQNLSQFLYSLKIIAHVIDSLA